MRWLAVGAAVVLVVWCGGCLGSGGGSSADGGGLDGGSGDGDGDSGGDGDGDGGDGDGDSGDGDGTVVDAGPPCVPADPEVIGEYMLVMRPSSVSNYGDVTVLQVQPNGALVELWQRGGVDPAQILPIPNGGFFAFINELQFSVNVYRISPLDDSVMGTGSVVVTDAQGFNVNTNAIAYDDAAKTLTTYDTTMAGWWATSFDFVLGDLQNPSRSFTGTESYFDPYDGYADRLGSTVAYDRNGQYSYTVDAMGVTIRQKDADGQYIDPTLFPLATMMYGAVNERILPMVVMSAPVTCD